MSTYSGGWKPGWPRKAPTIPAQADPKNPTASGQTYGPSPAGTLPQPKSSGSLPSLSPTPYNQGGPGVAGTPLPMDSIYNSQKAGIDTNLDQTLIGIGGERARAYSQFGYTANGEVDPTNPFSRAALLQRSYEQQSRGNNTSYAAQGQLYAGSYQNAIDQTDRGYAQSKYQLGTEFDSVLAGFNQREVDAKWQNTERTAGAQGEATYRALANRPEDPGLPAGAEGLPPELAKSILEGAPTFNDPAPGAVGTQAGWSDAETIKAFPLVEKTGPRAGMRYRVVRRSGGVKVRLYQDGEEVRIP